MTTRPLNPRSTLGFSPAPPHHVNERAGRASVDGAPIAQPAAHRVPALDEPPRADPPLNGDRYRLDAALLPAPPVGKAAVG